MPDNVPYTRAERAVLNHLMQGHENAISLADLVTFTTLPRRRVIGIIADLRMRHGLVVVGEKGSKDGAKSGYYIAETAEERARASKILRDQGIQMLRSAARMDRVSAPEISRELGQLSMELAS